MASTPERLSIVQSLATALKTIAKASGYFYDVSASAVFIDPVNLETISPALNPAFYVHVDAPGEREFLPALRMKDRLNFTVVGRVVASGTALDRKTTAGEQLLADIEKALTVDITRGGHAIDTRLSQAEGSLMQLGAGNLVVVVQPLVVVTRRVYGQP